MKSVIDEILAERERQKKEEGFSQQHDDRYRKGELVKAAICFAAMSIGCPQVLIKLAVHSMDVQSVWVDPWPWEEHWDKRNRHSANKCLVVAGALIVADLERRSRAGETLV